MSGSDNCDCLKCQKALFKLERVTFIALQKFFVCQTMSFWQKYNDLMSK